MAINKRATRRSAWLSFALAATAKANVVGGDLQNFNAVPGGIDYVTVQSSETLEPGYLNLGLMLNHAVNSLPYYEDEAQHRINYNDALTMADFGMGYGLASDFEIGLAIQRLLLQKVDKSAAHGEFSGPGVTNYRGYGKYRLWQAENWGMAGVFGVVFNNVANNPVVGRGGSPVGVIELAVDGKLKALAISANLGYRFRKKGDPIPGMRLLPMGDQYIASLGVSHLLKVIDTKLIVEVFGARPAVGTRSGMEVRQSSSAELLGGIKHDLTSALALHAGAGTELISGSATPDWRLYAGINWAIGPRARSAQEAALPLRIPPQAKEVRAILRNIHFATDSDQLSSDDEIELRALLNQLGTLRFDSIVVEGHTDSVGRLAYNQMLSEQRSATVRDWLVRHGRIDPKLVTSSGYGPSRPIADNGNFQGRQANRRVEVIIRFSGNVVQKTQELMGPPRPSPAAASEDQAAATPSAPPAASPMAP